MPAMSDKLRFVDDAREKPPSSENDKLKHIGHSALVDLALTTNGYFLPERAQGLKEAGLDRITISLDSLKRDVFKRMTGVDVLTKCLRASTRRRKLARTDKDQCRDRAWSQRR